MGRYSTLCRLPGNLYETGSPVLISAGALLRDDQIGRVLAQLKFKSLCDKEIKAIKVDLHTYDISGDELESVSGFQYLDLNAFRGDYFGDRKAIPVPNPVTRSIGVCVRSVLFADGTAWLCDNTEPWIALPHPVPLTEMLDSAELAGQYVRETSERSRFAPCELEDLWYCACGSVNKEDEAYCPACGVERSQIFGALDEELLEENYIKWVKQHDMDSSVEQIHTKKKKSKFFKVLLILLPILLVIAGGIFAVMQYVLPMLAYKRADEKLALHDFDGAIEGFTALGDYQDSADKVIAARYGAAVELMEQGELDKAKVEFILLGNYEDCQERIKKCDYIAAEKLFAAKNYDAAREAFLALGDYSDAAERADAALYSKAMDLASQGSNDEAVAIFRSLGTYADSEAQIEAIRQAEIDQVNRYIRQNKFDEAWAAYEKLEDYHPAALTRDDFKNPDGDMCDYLDENTTEDKFFGVYRYLANGYDSRKDVTVTAREIRLTDPRIAVVMAYGEPDESGKMITNGGFYTKLVDDESKAAMEAECDHYNRYSYNNYKIYFYFDTNDNVSWIIYSNDDYHCSTPDPVEEPAEETAQ